MKFELNEKEIETLKKWQEEIKLKYGKYGIYSYCFSPTGLGNNIIVKNTIFDIELDITDYSIW